MKHALQVDTPRRRQTPMDHLIQSFLADVFAFVGEAPEAISKTR
jgi:hypothetical protein